ncbi:MAG: glycosyltransferase family 2 protein [Candidatus Omnitrophica bacterium]|nr:glycosyltransferase family 2 protein [Candidatus Omnitrophota bacterium]
MADHPFISFIVPVYNEELNIAHMLHNLHGVLAQYPQWNSEVIVVEDGSRDGTRQVICQEIKKYPQTQLILHEENKGYTASLKDGIQKSRGRYLMYIGADEEFDSTELPQFMDILIKDEADVVLGVRWQRNAYTLFRFFLSMVYIFFLNYIFKLRVNDYNWSQIWSRKLFERIELKSKSLFVLPEIIIKAYDLKLKVKEVPSNHRGRRAGKSSLNMKIMGLAVWEALSFWQHRNSSRYQPDETAHQPFLTPRASDSNPAVSHSSFQ